MHDFNETGGIGRKYYGERYFAFVYPRNPLLRAATNCGCPEHADD